MILIKKLVPFVAAAMVSVSSAMSFNEEEDYAFMQEMDFDDNFLEMMLSQKETSEVLQNWMDEALEDDDDEMEDQEGEMEETMKKFFKPLTSCDPIRGDKDPNMITKKLITDAGYGFDLYKTNNGQGQMIDIYRIV